MTLSQNVAGALYKIVTRKQSAVNNTVMSGRLKKTPYVDDVLTCTEYVFRLSICT